MTYYSSVAGGFPAQRPLFLIIYSLHVSIIANRGARCKPCFLNCGDFGARVKIKRGMLDNGNIVKYNHGKKQIYACAARAAHHAAHALYEEL